MALIQAGGDGDHVLTLAAGGTLGFRYYGAIDGRPLIFFHGWPGSSRQGVFLDRIGKERGIRILAVDRPGFGSSSRLPERSFLDLPPMIGELAEAVGIDRFEVFGVSGGGPYALACAWALPHLVRAAVVCCGAPPLDSPEARRRFSPIYQAMLALNARLPSALRTLIAPATMIARFCPPWPAMRLFASFTGERDRQFLTDRAQFALFYPSFHDAMRAGHRAVYEDGNCYSRPWPFDVSEIRVPVRFWHGTRDTNFHHSLAERLAGRIPGAVFHLREEGHYSLPAFRLTEIIDDLLSVSPAPR